MKYAMAAAPPKAATPTTLAATPTAAHLLFDILASIRLFNFINCKIFNVLDFPKINSTERLFEVSG